MREPERAVEVHVGDAILQATGKYYPAEPDTWDEPGGPSWFEVDEVLAGEEDVTQLLSESAMDQVIHSAITRIEEDE